MLVCKNEANLAMMTALAQNLLRKCEANYVRSNDHDFGNSQRYVGSLE